MEKETVKNAVGDGRAGPAKERTSLFDCCLSCCGDKDAAMEKLGKWKDLCKGMADSEQKDRMMKMCFPQKKKKE